MPRHTFGTDIWENFMKFVPTRSKWLTPEVSYYDGMTDEVFAGLETFWRDIFLNVETEESHVDWEAPANQEAKTQLEAEIAGVNFYGSFLFTNEWWPMVSAHDP